VFDRNIEFLSETLNSSHEKEWKISQLESQLDARQIELLTIEIGTITQKLDWETKEATATFDIILTNNLDETVTVRKEGKSVGWVSNFQTERKSETHPTIATINNGTEPPTRKRAPKWKFSFFSGPVLTLILFLTFSHISVTHARHPNVELRTTLAGADTLNDPNLTLPTLAPDWTRSTLAVKYIQMVTMAFLMKNNFVILPIFIILVHGGDASSITTMKNGILFNHLGQTLLSPTTINSVKIYKPCDILIFNKRLLEVKKKTHALCATRIKNEHETSTLIKTVSNDFTLLNKPMSLPQARRACKSINSHLVFITNKKEAFNLYAFMAANGIQRTFTNIAMDRETAEPIFLSNGNTASNRYFDTIHDHSEGTNITWNNIIADYQNANQIDVSF
jgi:hypothetical protein